MAVCSFALWKPVQNHGGRMGANLGLILHVQQGNGSLAGWFNNRASGASSTWWVAKNGTLEQYVDSTVCAWAQAAGNGEYCSVETEGYTTEALTPQQEATLTKLYDWGMKTHKWPKQVTDAVGRPGFGWHGMGGTSWGNHPGCPGDLRKNRRQPILNAIGGTAPPSPQPAPKPPSTAKAPPFPYPSGHYIGTARSDPYCHSGCYGGTDANNTRTWQQQMKNRGWAIGVDGCYGSQSEGICRQFQAEKGLKVDGLVGPQTWSTSWTAPVT